MKYIKLFLLTIILTSTLFASDLKFTHEEAFKEANKIKEKCFKKYLKKDSYETHTAMIELHEGTLVCIKDKINKEIEKGFKGEERKQILKEYEVLYKDYMIFYKSYYNLSRYCTPYCGNMTVEINISQSINLSVNILSDLIYLNKNEDF